MIETPLESTPPIASRLAVVRGGCVIAAFWGAFVLAACSALLPPGVGRMASSVAQSVLAAIWVGYPLAVFYCLAGRRIRTVGVVSLSFGAVAGIALDSIAGANRLGNSAAVIGSLLLISPFVAGAYALKIREEQRNGRRGSSVVLTTLAFLALPFFGAYVQTRVKAALAEAVVCE